MPHEHSLPLWLTHKQTSLHLFRSRTNKHCLANLNQHHMPHEHSYKLLFTSLAHAQTNIASRTSTNITCHTNIPTSFAPAQTNFSSPLSPLCSRTNKHCLANLNQHHMPHEHSSPLSLPQHFSSPLSLPHKQTLPREPQPTSHATRTFTKKLLFTSLLTHKQTLPREPQPTSHATRTFLTKLLFTSFAHAQTNIASRTSTNITCKKLLFTSFSPPREPQPTSHATRTFPNQTHAQTNIASRTSTNITCHTNIPNQTSLHLFGSRTNKHCLANLNQHHMPHEHSL